MSSTKTTLYNPKEIEPQWSHRLALAPTPPIDPQKTPFSLLFPLKSLGSTLDLNEILQYALQDGYARFKRMQGHPVTYIPGILYEDEIQSYVERRYRKQMLPFIRSKRELFEEKWREWKQEQNQELLQHLQNIGISCEYAKMRYSDDPLFQESLQKAFIQLFQEKLLRTHPLLVRWCTRCDMRVLNEDQMEVEAEVGSYLIKLPLTPLKTPQSEKEILYLNIFLEQLELLFGIQALVVPYKDERFSPWVGRTVLLPIAEREVPIVLDRTLGQGAEVFPIIPAHSKEGFQFAQQQDLPLINVFNFQGVLTSLAGEGFSGLTREQCRTKLLAILRERQLLVASKTPDQEYRERKKIQMIKCFRCASQTDLLLFNRYVLQTGSLVKDLESHLPEQEARKQRQLRRKRGTSRFLEPLLKKEPLFSSHKRAKLFWKLVRYQKEWILSVPDWGGTPIPLWYCSNCGEIPSLQTLQTCPQCQGTTLLQEQGILSAQFAEILWPAIVLKNNFLNEKKIENTPQVPTTPSTLQPSHQIFITSSSFISLGKMVLAGSHFSHSTPFKTLYLSAALQEKARKDSHLSLDSLIKRYGADAIRFSLLRLASEGRNVKLANNWYRPGQKFVHKLWNLSLLARRILPPNLEPLPPNSHFTFEDQWILSNIHRILDKYTLLIEELQFQKAIHLLWNFVFRSFSFYLEIAKDRLYLGHPDSRKKESPELLSSQRVAQHCLVEIFQIVLKTTFILCPFITEEIWFHFSKQCNAFPSDLLSQQSWPHYDSSKVDGSIELQMKRIEELVQALRKLLQQYGTKLPFPRTLGIRPTSAQSSELLKSHFGLLCSFFHREHLSILQEDRYHPGQVLEILNGATLSIELDPQSLHPAPLIKTLRKKMQKMAHAIEICNTHFNNRHNETYLRSVDPLVQLRQRNLLERYQKFNEYVAYLKNRLD